MDTPEAFDAVSRALLMTALYKRGLPEETIKQIRRGRQGKRLAPKYKWSYGVPKENDKGGFRRSAISAILFIIYLGDMMGI